MRFLGLLFSTIFVIAVIGVGGVAFVFWHYGRTLPDYTQLAHYEPPVTTRVYAGDGRLVAEYAVEKRNFVPLSATPDRVVQAFLAAEDKAFFTHPGIDLMGVARAIVTNLKNRGDKRPQGASTITQQVAKNFLLTNELSYERKVKELILAFRIERTFSKQHILELYLNEIYLGQGSYGVAAAALNYFNKGLDELTIAEAAYLAALPKAPNNYNPVRNPQGAKERRDWVIGRMYEDGHITREEAQAAIAEPLVVRRRDETQLVHGADYFAEDIRRELIARYGEEALYKGGLAVRATVKPALQQIANKALRDGLVAYDRRHGWRGALGKIQLGPGWHTRLEQFQAPEGIEPPWERAVVLSTGDKAAEIGFVDGGKGEIPVAEVKWARPTQDGLRLGNAPRVPGDVLAPGDVIAVEPLKDDKGTPKAGQYALRQIPKIDGALVALDPHTGRVLAMAGGFSYARSEFNRATQALRQPGSSFKPFVYLTALENGFSPSSLVLDAPVEIDQGPGMAKWRPQNYSGDFMGPTTLRVGIEKSRNLMTVRLAEAVGMDKVAATAKRFGIADNMAPVLSMSLGAGETTVLRMTAGYAMLVNGGKRVRPTLIDRIQDRSGTTIYRHDARACGGCLAPAYGSGDMPRIPDVREQVADPLSAYQMVSILEGVVQRGTGTAALAVKKPLAGKTGTSNDSHDTWFVGFSPDLVVGVFVGFDEPATLGSRETGGSVAAPIFRDFMKEALKDEPATPFRVPPGIRLVRVNLQTGLPAEPGDAKVIWEAFKPDQIPSGEFPPPVLGGAIAGLGLGGLGGIEASEGYVGSDGVTGIPAGAGLGGAGSSGGGAPAGNIVPSAGGLY